MGVARTGPTCSMSEVKIVVEKWRIYRGHVIIGLVEFSILSSQLSIQHIQHAPLYLWSKSLSDSLSIRLPCFHLKLTRFAIRGLGTIVPGFKVALDSIFVLFA